MPEPRAYEARERVAAFIRAWDAPNVSDQLASVIREDGRFPLLLSDLRLLTADNGDAPVVTHG